MKRALQVTLLTTTVLLAACSADHDELRQWMEQASAYRNSSSRLAGG